MYLPVKTSVAFTAGDIVISTAGLVDVATSASVPGLAIGVIRHAIASTDSDYTTARIVEVEVPVEKNCEWEIASASLVAADLMLEVDLTDARTVNRGASSVKIVRATKVISTTLGWFHIKFGGAY